MVAPLAARDVIERLDNIPDELCQLDRWVVWRYDGRDAKPTKVPYQCRAPASHAKADDPSTWGTFADAVAVARAGATLGIGFMLGDGIVGIDLDHCIDAVTGALAGWASEYLTLLDSYSEITPSRTGVHILARGALPAGRRRKGSVEMYDAGRFFTVTGDHFPDTPRTLEERTGELLTMHAAVFGADNGNAQVRESPNSVRSEPHGSPGDDPFAALYRGDTSRNGGDDSAADLALCGRMARVTRDPLIIDRMFRASGLMREKWNEPRGRQTYGERTIAKALETPRSGPSADETTARPYQLYAAAELDQLPAQSWIIADAIPANGLVALIGAKGTLKTFITLDLACHIASGDPWHERATTACPVLYVYAEGPFGAKARVGAWCAFHSYATGRTITPADLPLWFLPVRIPINRPAEVAALLTEIRQLSVTPRVVVIDTLNSNLDGDENGEGMGGFVAGCATLRTALNATVISVHHTPLGADDRGRGHSSFDGAIDTRLIVSRDDDRVTLECTHQRNGMDGWNLAFDTVPIAGSLALKPSAPNAGQLKGQRRAILELVHSDGPMACTTWERESGLGKSSFHKARRWLLANSYVKLEKRRYTATEAGRLALGAPQCTERALQ